MPAKKVIFRITSDYQVERLIGQGAFGVVCSAVHQPSGKKVAIKKITPFDHNGACRRAMREIKLLRRLDHENIVHLFDLHMAERSDGAHEIYLIQELMETDMQCVIKTQTLSDDHCQYFVYQLLQGLRAMHAANIIHRDLKPSNLLVNSDCSLKICDFGLARSTGEMDRVEPVMTQYVATRWYRAPEVMLTFGRYTKAIDMWSVGCVLAEMVLGDPLFPGHNDPDQLQRMIRVLGRPTWEDLVAIKARTTCHFLNDLPGPSKVDMASHFPPTSRSAVPLLKQLLVYNPSKRITAQDALEHPYLQAYRRVEANPSALALEADELSALDELENIQGRETWSELIRQEIAAHQANARTPEGLWQQERQRTGNSRDDLDHSDT